MVTKEGIIMTRGILTKIRRIFIIKILLDGNEWHTQGILREVESLEFKYYTQKENFRPETVEPINNAKISTILGDLLKENIIETKALSRLEKGTGNKYWLKRGIKPIYMILRELNNAKISQSFISSAVFLCTSSSMRTSLIYIKYWLINSEYGKESINLELEELILPKFLSSILNEEEKQFVLTILKLSPTALYNTLKAFIEEDYWTDRSKSFYNFKEHQFYWKERFFTDIKFWLYEDFRDPGFVFGKDVEVNFNVLVSINHNNNEFKQCSKRISLHPPDVRSPEVNLPIGENREDFENLWLKMGDEALKDKNMVNKRNSYDMMDKFKVLVQKKKDLQKQTYEGLKKISEMKTTKKDKNEKRKKRERLIEEYYTQHNDLNDKIRAYEDKHNIITDAYDY